ncbi:MAG: DUF1508 domain-containing protein [Christensenellales bacterium]
MVNFDDIEFLESEIVDDDDTAPVGTLVHITDDGKVEEIKNENNALQETSTQSDNSVKGEANVDTTLVDDENKEEIAQEQSEEIPSVSDEKETNIESELNEAQSDVAHEIVEDEQEEQVVEDSVENAQESVEQVEDAQPVEEPTAQTEDTGLEQADETPVENVIDEVDEAEQQAEKAQDVEPVSVEQEEVALDTQEQESVKETQPVEEEITPAPKAKKPGKTAQKKEVTPVVNDEEHKTSLNLKSGKSVNDELFDTNFEVEKPAKTKVVSTKKKQEKAEDLWAVATLTKTKKETAPAEEKAEVKSVNKSSKSAPKAQKQSDDAQVATKKTASKKSTKVEDTKTPTEEKKVAKATDKTTKPVQEEKPVKATKTAKAQKETPVKETAVKESPVKEDNAPKATKAVEKDEETVLVEGEGKVHGKYVIKKTDKGNFVFKLFSSNYRVVAIGAQAYTTLGAAKIGVQSIINNAEKAPVENQTLKNYETLKFPKWEIYLDKKGEYRLRLYATNGSLIATTNDGYADISGAKNGIAAVARASKGCAIVRNDNLW